MIAAPLHEELHKLLMVAAKDGASDLHISPDSVPRVRIDGEILRIEGISPLSKEQVKHYLQDLLPQHAAEQPLKEHDGSFSLDRHYRIRYNLYHTLDGLAAAFRFIPFEAPDLNTLALPPQLQDIAKLHKGLVLVCGPTGSGKSSTIAALLKHINARQKKHIITIEDPIEYLHPSDVSLIHQRELGVHTKSYSNALRAALREDPDIIMVGEMRDPETIQTALTAAETGHLVLSTMHTFSAAKAVDRIVDAFPKQSQDMIVSMLSTSIEAIISQSLIRRQNGGRVAATEVMLASPAIRNLIRERKQFQIPSLIETSMQYGMHSMQHSIKALIDEGVISPEEASRTARLHQLAEDKGTQSPAKAFANSGDEHF